MLYDLVSQLFTKPPFPTANFTGKTVIVTGANVGLGKEAAKHFVRLNAERVIATVRSIARSESAKAEIEAETKRTDILELWELDYGRFESVLAFGAKVARLSRLDAAVLNAGIATDKYELLEGDESTITVNVVSTALLSLILLPTLQASAVKHGIEPVLTVVGSGVHESAGLQECKSPHIFEALNNRETAMHGRYPLSKLLQLFVVLEMAERTRDKRPFVVINTLSPGLCYTELARDTDRSVRFRLSVLRAIFAWTAEEGARTLVHATIAGKESHGKFISGCKVENKSQAIFVTSPEGIEAQKKFWKELGGKLEAIQPGVTRNLD